MSLRGIPLVARTILSAALACGAYAQSADFENQLAEARQLRGQGRYGEAKVALTALLQDARRREPEGVLVGVVLDCLGATAQDSGNFVDAERALTDAISQFQKAGEADGVNTAVAKGHLGEVYLEETRYHEAEAVLRQALRIRQNLGDSVELSVVIVDLAMACEHTHRAPEAEALLRQALDSLEKQAGPKHPILTAALGPLSSLLARSGRYAEALTYTERAWEILRLDPTVGEPDLLNTMSSLGTLYSCLGRRQEAELYSKQAADRAEVVYGPDHSRLAWYLKGYAQVLQRAGRKAEAKAVESRSNAILARNAQGNSVQHTVNVNALR